MSWDTIKPAAELDRSQIRRQLSQLQERHSERTRDNPDFIYMKEQKALISEIRNKTEISLNETVRREERAANEERELALENKRRKAKGIPLLVSLEEKPEEENPQIADTEKDGLDKESDPLLEEAGSIMMDYVDLTIGSHLTAQRR